MLLQGINNSCTLYVTCRKHKFMSGKDGFLIGDWRPLWGFVYEIVNSIGQGKLTY